MTAARACGSCRQLVLVFRLQGEHATQKSSHPVLVRPDSSSILTLFAAKQQLIAQSMLHIIIMLVY